MPSTYSTGYASGSIYREQGNQREVFSSGCQADFENGSVLNIEGKINLNSVVKSTAKTGISLPNFGLSVLESTRTSQSATLAGPRAGSLKFISFSNPTSGSTHGAKHIHSSGGAGFGYESGLTLIASSNSTISGITLVGESSQKWRIVGIACTELDMISISTSTA